MKARFLIIVCLLLNQVMTMYGSELCPRPNDFRIMDLRSSLDNYGSGRPFLQWLSDDYHDLSQKVYTFTWKKTTAHKTPEKELSFDRAIQKADTFLRSKLPDSILPRPLRVLSAGKYMLGNNLSSNYIWVIEFDVKDYSPMAGAGYPPTLFVPLDSSGNVLLHVSIK